MGIRMGEFWQSRSVTNDTEELVFHAGYKTSGPKRRIAAAWRQHTRLRAPLVNHRGAAATHIPPARVRLA